MIKEFANCNKVLTGVEITESELTDRSHRTLLHTVEEVDKVAIKIVIYLEGVDSRLSEKYASAAAEHIDKTSIVQRKQRIEDVQNCTFVSYTGYRGFRVDHLAFHEVPTAP